MASITTLHISDFPSEGRKLSWLAHCSSDRTVWVFATVYAGFNLLCVCTMCVVCVRWYQCGFEPYVASHFTGVCKKVLVLRTVCVRIYVHVCELM